MALINPLNPISCLDDIQALRWSVDQSNIDGKNIISFTPANYWLLLSTLVDFEWVSVNPTNPNGFSMSYAKIKNRAIDMVRPEYDQNGVCCKFSYETIDNRFMDTDFFKADFNSNTIVFGTDLELKGSNFNFIAGQDYSDIILSVGWLLQQAQIVSYNAATWTITLNKTVTALKGKAVRIMWVPVIWGAAQYDCNLISKCYRFGVKNSKKECGDVVLATGCINLKPCELNFERRKSNNFADGHMTINEWLQEFVYKTAEKMFMSSVTTHVLNTIIDNVKKYETPTNQRTFDFKACVCDPKICDDVAIAKVIKTQIFDKLETAPIDGDYIMYVDVRSMNKRGRLKTSLNYVSYNVNTVYMPWYNANLESLYSDKIAFKNESISQISLANGRVITIVPLKELSDAEQTYNINVNASVNVADNISIIVPKDYISLVTMREMYMDRNMTIQNKVKDGYLTVVTSKLNGGEAASGVNVCDTKFDFGMRYGVLIKNAAMIPMFIIKNIWTKDDCTSYTCNPAVVPVDVVLPAHC